MSEENNNLEDKASDAFENAKNKTNEVVNEAKEAASEIADEAKEKFEEAKEVTKEFAENAKEKAHEFADEAKKTANEFTENFKQATANGENKKIIAGILAIVLGSIGIHKFILGYTKEGIIQIIASIVTCGVAGVIPFVEGIIYLTKSDEEFYQTYQVNKRAWF